jgi:uncharacterized Zn finger protein
MAKKAINPNVHIICGKCGCATMMEYQVVTSKDIEDKPETHVYLNCGNCGTITNLDELIDNRLNKH